MRERICVVLDFLFFAWVSEMGRRTFMARLKCALEGRRCSSSSEESRDSPSIREYRSPVEGELRRSDMVWLYVLGRNSCKGIEVLLMSEEWVTSR